MKLRIAKKILKRRDRCKYNPTQIKVAEARVKRAEKKDEGD